MDWITFAASAVNVTAACMFLGAWFFTRQSAFVSFTCGYGLFAISFALFALKEHASGLLHLGNTAMIVGTLVSAYGLAQRGKWAVAWKPVGALAVWGLVGNAASFFLDDTSLRFVALYTSLGLMYLLVAYAGQQAKARFPVERVLVIVLYVVAALLLANPRLLSSLLPNLLPMEIAYNTWPIYAVVWIIVSQLLAGTTIALSMRDVIVSARQEAETDALTGLANRRAFDRAIQRQGRKDDLAALVMIDIDHFKRINDSFGHDEGDRCIALVAGLIAQAAPEGTHAVRLGGEEFAVLVNDGGVATASAVAQNIHNNIRQATRPLNFTVSIGVSEGPRDVLYKRADEALYQAKNDGRNKTCVWEGRGEYEAATSQADTVRT
ncbi:diguanylate cyclase [Ahrensia sp. R2A130]|uniref:GGDEF domain-containing protein n=1 Tax=Ahrensia sp. R2A130 TaxID=744979 RepID=UPI0001E08C94|nr:GGDEF domain-containing protein [Ahrensia sp. R2A130]EFL88110.1 diguanylate cyclase [Ahrensia sp. R2A130]